jgi:D-glycero-D-manno-heptose 1,7-bisphosphate phosphatase
MGMPAIFLDRDGVIIENRADYVKSWDEVKILAGALESLRRLAKTTFRNIIVTNQSAVGRGIITFDQALELNQGVIKLIESSGGRVDASYMCPHRPDEKCPCRKPAPGMLNQAKDDLDIDFKASFLIGDAMTDIQAALSVGARGILVLTGRGSEQLPRLKSVGLKEVLIAKDLAEAVELILTMESREA